ncbi:18439_t:CDS:2, partial [Gigaspora margarita]
NSLISSSHQGYAIALVNSLETMPKGSDELFQVEIVQRKVKALWNKLTLEKFDSISEQIIKYANKSTLERDGCILKEIMEKIDPEIMDENVQIQMANSFMV